MRKLSYRVSPRHRRSGGQAQAISPAGRGPAGQRAPAAGGHAGALLAGGMAPGRFPRPPVMSAGTPRAFNLPFLILKTRNTF